MNAVILPTFCSALPYRPHRGLDNAAVLFLLMGAYRRNRGHLLCLDEAQDKTQDKTQDKNIAINAPIEPAIAKWFSLEQFTQSGRCRTTLAPT